MMPSPVKCNSPGCQASMEAKCREIARLRKILSSVKEAIQQECSTSPSFSASTPLKEGKFFFDPDETYYAPGELDKCVNNEGPVLDVSARDARSTSPILGRKATASVQKRRIYAETSYDRLPSNKEGIPDNVRGKLRKQLPGHTCDKCKSQYEECGFGRDVVQKCSRHRSTFPRASTPPGFWDVDFPPTQEILKKQCGP